MRHGSLLAVLVPAATIVWAIAFAADAPPPVTPSASVSLAPKSITVPHDEPYLPPLPGRDAFVSNCVVRHTPRYISGQPNFPRAVWTAEVTKMIKVNGAPIVPEYVAAIINYLTACNGQEDKAP